MAQHTPAPWTAGKNWLAGGASKVTASGKTVAYVPYIKGGNGFAISGTDETNARLIAAAPDLLKALKNYVAWLEPVEHGNVTMAELHEAAKAAIAKATGG